MIIILLLILGAAILVLFALFRVGVKEITLPVVEFYVAPAAEEETILFRSSDPPKVVFTSRSVKTIQKLDMDSGPYDLLVRDNEVIFWRKSNDN